MKPMDNVYVVGYVRTPIANFMGSFKDLSVPDLGVIAVKELIRRTGVDPQLVEELECGTVHQEGQKGNPGRQIQIKSGLPQTGWASTVNQQCSSGIRALDMIATNILLGRIDVGIAVGAECMSSVPHLLLKSRSGMRLGDERIVDALFYDGFIGAMTGYHMGVTAENLAEKYGISREEQDEWSKRSHDVAVEAWRLKRFENVVVPVASKGKRGAITVVEQDEHPRETSMEELGKLKPAFKENGTVTAGNASGICDAAAAMLVMSETAVRKTGIKPIARLLSVECVGVDPAYMGIGPAYAIPKALQAAGLRQADIGLFEINEAFAAQLLACNRELKIPVDRLNVNGSGISLGHPVGATGVRIIGDTIDEAIRRGVQYGVASLCAGGGPSIAAVYEVLQ